jgi:hypothetical protein
MKRTPTRYWGHMINRPVLSGLALAGLLHPAWAYDLKTRLDLEPLIVKHATANNVPAGLIHRIIIRESRYNPRAVGRGGALGLMQIKHGTARALGYTGAATGLLDADTNLTYGVRYLAGAYRVAGGDQNRAVGFYARGYYYDAKRKGLTGSFVKGPEAPEAVVVVAAAAPQPAEAAAAQTAAEEPEQVVPPRRNGRPAKRKTATVGNAFAQQIPVQVGAAGAVQAPARQTESPVRTQPVAGPTQRKAPGAAQALHQGTPVPALAMQEPPPRPNRQAANAIVTVKRSVRSAKPTATSGADRSEQKVSAQQGDPGTRP